MGKKQLLPVLLAFGIFTFWQVRRSGAKDLLELTSPLEVVVATAPFRREAALLEAPEHEFREATLAVSMTTTTTTARSGDQNAVPSTRSPQRLPNHLAKMPGCKAWRPPDFEVLPVMPPEVWNASRAEMPPGQRYPLVEGMLQRLQANETVRIEVYGGSMTFGSQCCSKCNMKEGQCAWPSLFAAYLQDAFPDAVQLLSYARGGCNLECAESEMVVAQKSAKVPPDWIILDFSQNGWGGQDHKLEEFIRICHLFLPQTFVLLVWNRDMGSFAHTDRDSQNLKNVRSVAEHYNLPLLNYEKAVEEFSRLGGAESSMWPRDVQPTSWPDWAYRHPLWPGHAYYADMLADWMNHELQRLGNTAVDQPRPELQSPRDVTADQDWIQPLRKQNLENVDLCLFPLTTHLARNPESHTPLQSSGGHWRLFEDRRNKPGWIVTTKNETIVFNVTFSAKPKLALQYLRSYENVGTAELTIRSPYVWNCKQLDGQGNHKSVWKLQGIWPPRISITVGAVFTAGGGSVLPEAQTAQVALRLVDGPKFKLLSVISC